jgi:membrane protease YdiL (CAAX protease family)
MNDPVWQWQILIGIVAVSLTLWAMVIVRWARGRPALLYQPRRAVPWGLVHLLLALAVWILFQAATYPILQHYFGISLDGGFEQLPPPHQIVVLTAGAASTLLALGTWLALIAWRTGATLRDLGWDSAQLMRDGTIGVIAFVMLAVPVFTIQWILTQWLSIESKHPLVDVVLEQRRLDYLLCSGFAALVAAPLFEEFLFRVLLQGWLENVAGSLRASPSRAQALARWSDLWVFGLRQPSSPAVSQAETDEDRQVDRPADEHPASASFSARGESSTAENAGPDRDSVDFPLQVRPAIWPTVVGAGLFALAHFGHGADPIPLFVLALGIGYLYQRTHRVVPCIVVHFLINAVTMLQLWWMVSQQAA